MIPVEPFKFENSSKSFSTHSWRQYPRHNWASMFCFWCKASKSLKFATFFYRKDQDDIFVPLKEEIEIEHDHCTGSLKNQKDQYKPKETENILWCYLKFHCEKMSKEQPQKYDTQGSYPFLNKKFKDFSRTFKDTFPIFFKVSIQCKKEPWVLCLFSVPPQHDQFYPEGLSVFDPCGNLRIWVG